MSCNTQNVEILILIPHIITLHTERIEYVRAHLHVPLVFSLENALFLFHSFSLFFSLLLLSYTYSFFLSPPPSSLRSRLTSRACLMNTQALRYIGLFPRPKSLKLFHMCTVEQYRTNVKRLCKYTNIEQQLQQSSTKEKKKTRAE